MVENPRRAKSLSAVAMLAAAALLIGGEFLGGEPDIAPHTEHFTVQARLFAWELHDFKTVLIRGERSASASATERQ